MTVKETKVKVSQEGVCGAASAVDDSQFNLDGILSELGSFGKYQLLLLFLLAFRDSFLAMCNFNYVFTAAEVPFRCVVPECEDTDSGFNASWQSFAVGNHSQICHKMIPLGDHERDLISVSNKSSTSLNFSSSKCAPDFFSTDTIYPCEKVVYENYNSIVAEFDLGCQPFKRTLIGTIHNLGLVFSYVVSGIISDRYGRKVIIVATPLVVGTVGLLKSFSVNYWMLIVMEFLETALGYGNASLVLSLESVSHKRRVVFSCISDILCSFGSAFFGLIAWRVQYWRHLIRAIYAPLLVVVFYIFLVDEGVRWLLAHNKNLEAVRVLNKVAKINKITLSNKAKEMLSKISKENEAIEAGEATESGGSAGSWASVWEVLRSRRIVSRMALMAACFVCGMFVYNGTIVNATSISGDKYVNLSALFLVSVPTRVVTALTLTRFGRRAPICLAYCFCAVFFITSAFVPKNVWWASVVLYVVGKMCSSYGVFSLNVVALEVFPTTSRNTLTNIANTFGRLGSVLAPQAPLLEKYMSGLTSILFGVVALGPAALALLLPDTTHVSLPDNVAAAERLDSANRKNNDGNLKAADQKWTDHTTLGGLSKPTLDGTGHTNDAQTMRDAKPKHHDLGNS